MTSVGKTPTSTTATTTRTTDAARFANKQPYARVVGYDESSRTVRFRVLTAHVREGMQDEYDYDPHDSATHTVSLARSASIDGVGQGSAICPQASDGSCTTAQLAAAARDRDASVIVQLVINSDEQVTEVAEQVGAIL